MMTYFPQTWCLPTLTVICNSVQMHYNEFYSCDCWESGVATIKSWFTSDWMKSWNFISSFVSYRVNISSSSQHWRWGCHHGDSGHCRAGEINHPHVPNPTSRQTFSFDEWNRNIKTWVLCHYLDEAGVLLLLVYCKCRNKVKYLPT